MLQILAQIINYNNINIFRMLSKSDRYRQMIQQTTKRVVLFPHMNKPEKKPTVRMYCDIKLPSSHQFRSSQQIEKNTPITHHITHQSPKWCHTELYNNSCIGLILCEHYQNNQTFYVYGTGTLIHNNIVFTSAQNVYCRRLNTQYTKIRFITGVCGDKCNRIYDVMRVHYPKEYCMQDYKDYNFAMLQLYDDLSESCGYVGWKTISDIKEVEKYTEYGYINGNQEGSFILAQMIIDQKSSQDQCCSGSGVLVNENQKYSIVGINNSANTEKFRNLSDKIRKIINQWTYYTTINLNYNNTGAQGCKYLSQVNWTHLKQIYLWQNQIGAQGCKYLSQANWTNLTRIDLVYNNIRAQGCKYLSQANWTNLTQFSLDWNKISAQGCKYLSQANWVHLNKIQFSVNQHSAQGCKYLSQANWTYLSIINLKRNDIGTQGCKYLSQANWKYLSRINLAYNNIDAQGCKYLSQANWPHMNNFNLRSNNIGAQGCRYLSQTNWIILNSITLRSNKICAQGCKYLSQANWKHLSYINLNGNEIKDIIYRLLLLSSYQNIKIQI